MLAYRASPTDDVRSEHQADADGAVIAGAVLAAPSAVDDLGVVFGVVDGAGAGDTLERRRDQEVVEEELAVLLLGHEVVEDRAVAKGGIGIVEGMHELPLRDEGAADDRVTTPWARYCSSK